MKGTPLPIREDEVPAGEPVLAAGFPLAGLLSSDMNVSVGIVSATAGLRGNQYQLQVSAPVQPGNSGGPLLDAAGNLAGLVVGKLDAIEVAKLTGDIPQNVNFAVKSSVAGAFLNVAGVKRTYELRTVRLDNVQLADLARASTVQVICR